MENLAQELVAKTQLQRESDDEQLLHQSHSEKAIEEEPFVESEEPTPPLNESHSEDEFEEETWPVVAEKIKSIIEYQFQNLNLLEQAFTDHSYFEQGSNAIGSNERLEYMGDAFLNFFMAREHYLTHPELTSGKLTKLRSVNVDTEKLARSGLHHRLHRFLRHNKPLLAEQVKQFREAIVNYPMHSVGLIDAPKALANVVESLIGAVYMDSNSVEITSKVVERLLQPMITPLSLPTRPMTMLQEICQKHKVSMEMHDSWEKTGDFEFVVNGDIVGRANYHAKRLVALNRAALDAYQKFVAKLNQEQQNEENTVMEDID